MKASLVSATSIAALLAWECGPAVAGPEFSLSTTDMNSTCNNVASPSNCTLNLYALPGQSSAGVTVTMTADVAITGTSAFSAAPVVPSGFSGKASTGPGTLPIGHTFTSDPYSFLGASSAGSSGITSPTVGAATATVTKGTGKNANGAQTSALTLNGYTVAPVQQLSSTSPVYARAGGSSVTATVTVKNVGNGNLDTAVAQAVSNLNGSVSAISGTNWTGGVQTFSIQDSNSSTTTSKTFTYTYGPQARGASSSGALNAVFTNGNSSGSNASQTVPVTLIGNTVGPIYKSTWPGSTDNTPPAGGTATKAIDFGTVGAGSHTQTLTLANISTDANGGNHTLTDLSIESFTISGGGASKFNIGGAQSGTLGTVLSEGGSTLIDIGFNTTVGGTYNALLTFVTDQDAAFGAAGDTFSYRLTALAALAPEPASMLLLSVGIGGMLIVRRRRRQL